MNSETRLHEIRRETVGFAEMSRSSSYLSETADYLYWFGLTRSGEAQISLVIQAAAHEEMQLPKAA